MNDESKNDDNHDESKIEGPENKQNEQKDDEDLIFYFFFDLLRKMILKRQVIGDVCVLSMWLKALEKTKDKTTRNAYIKLMVLALEQPDPICPFKEPPPDKIDPLENGVIEMSRRLKKKEGTATCAAETESQAGDSNPPISTAVSIDTCEFASCQVIPNVGVQCFYAFSDEPMYLWSLPKQINIPKDTPHARDIDWERALAGVQREPCKPNHENDEQNSNQNNNTENENEKDSGNGFNKKKSDKTKGNEESEICKVMYIEQQNRNVTEEFEWNNNSLLTGEIIISAEMCSDRKVDAQVKTQSELDEDAINAYNKLYPGDFKILVEPIVVDDILPVKKYVSMEAGDKNGTKEPQFDETLAKKHDHTTKKLDCQDSKNNIRQSAGQENIQIPDDYYGDGKKKNSQKHKINELSADVALLMSKYKNCKYADTKFPKTVESFKDISSYKAQASEISDNFERPIDNKSLFQRDLLNYQRQINMAEECFGNTRSLLRINRKERKTISRDSSCSDFDKPPDA